MIYRVVLDNVEDIHMQDNPLLNPSLELEMNSAGSFKFTLPPMHPAWDEVKVLKTTVDVFEGEDLIFTGRVANIDKNWNNERVVECEGALAFFNDSVQRQMKWENPIKISEFLTDILNNHNTQVPDNRKIYLGNVTITDSYVTREVNYEMTLDILTRMCIDTNGGWFMIRKDLSDNKLYLDWFEDFTNESDQPVQFGLNLLDFSSGIHAEDICTGVLARGATVNDQVVMLNNVELVDEETYPDLPVSHYTDRDQDILWHREGVETYGKVLQVKEFSDAQTDWKDGQGQIVENSLFELAKKWLVEKNTKVETIEVEAAELAWLGSGYPTFQLGTLVELNDSPHISESIKLPMYKISLSLDDGAKKITLGTPPKKELTQISASNSDSNTLSTGSSSSGGGSGGGGTECLVQDVWVNGVSVVSGKIARITVPIDTVTQSQMNTAINAAVAPKANTSDVNDALALKANTIDVTNALALKADKTEIIEVEANPSETATDDLTTIKIGDTVYDIPRGGGGGSGQDYECDLLFENTNGTLPELSSTLFATLSEYISDYDALFIETSLYYNNDFHQAKPLIIFKQDYNFANSDGLQFVQDFSAGSSDYRLFIQLYDETHIYAFRTTSSGGGASAMTIAKVYGLKFKSSIDIFSPQIYSEEERIVGVWTDGKPLYQKTWDFGSNPVTIPSNTWVNTPITVSSINVEKFISALATSESTNSWNVLTAADQTYVRLNQTRSSGQMTVKYLTLTYTKTTDTPGSSHWLSGGVMAVNYTEEEQIVGQWMGKTLYQKSIAFNNESTQNLSIEVTSLNIDRLVNNELSTGVMNPQNQCGDGSFMDSSDYFNMYLEYTTAGAAAYVHIRRGYDWDKCPNGYVTLRYTKTTDTVGNPMANILATQKELEEIAYHYRDHCYTTLSDYYSTEERVVGRWTDGKPLYQKSYSYNNLSSTEISINVSDLYIERLVKSDISTGFQTPRNMSADSYYYNNNDYSNYYLATDDMTLHIRRGSDWPKTSNGFVTIQYTKTTDQPGTGPTPGNLIYLPALYSEEEREVGVWTDGKPLYQKVIHKNGLPLNVDTAICDDPSNIDILVSIEDHFHLSDPADVGNNYYSSNTDQYRTWRYQGKIWIGCYTFRSSAAMAASSVDIIIQYTKTTDQPGSGKYLPDGQYAHHYSTSEKIVGTWIDGSTIYERTWDFSASPITLTYDTWVSTGIDSSNFGQLVNSIARSNSGILDYIGEISDQGTEIKIRRTWNQNYERKLYYLTLQYTKTS